MPLKKTNKTPNPTKIADELNGLCKKLKAAMDKKKNLTTNKFVAMYDKSCILRSQLEGLAMSLLDAKDSKQFDYVAEISHRSSKILSNFEKMTNRPTFQTNVSSLTNITNTNAGSAESGTGFLNNNTSLFPSSSTMLNNSTSVLNRPSSSVLGSTSLPKTTGVKEREETSAPLPHVLDSTLVDDAFSDSQGWANFDNADHLDPKSVKPKLGKTKLDSILDDLEDKIVYKKDYHDTNMDTSLDHFNTSVDYNLSFEYKDEVKDDRLPRSDDELVESEFKYRVAEKAGYKTKDTHRGRNVDYKDDRESDQRMGRKERGKDRDRERETRSKTEYRREVVRGMNVRDVRDNRELRDARDRDLNKEDTDRLRYERDHVSRDREMEREYGSLRHSEREYLREGSDVDKNNYIKLLERCLLQTKHKGLVYQLNNEQMGGDYRNKVNIVNNYLTSGQELEDDREYRSYDRDDLDGMRGDDFVRKDLEYRGYVDRGNFGKNREFRDPRDGTLNREAMEVVGNKDRFDRDNRELRDARDRDYESLNKSMNKGSVSNLNKNEMYNEFKNVNEFPQFPETEKHKGEELKLYGNTTLATTGGSRYSNKTDLLNYELSNNELYGKEIEPLWRCENDGGLSSYLGNYIINNNVSSSSFGSTDLRSNFVGTGGNTSTMNMNDSSKRLVVTNTNNVNRLISLNKYKLELNINELNRENYVLNLQLLLYTYINISNIYIYLIYNDSNTVSGNVNNVNNYSRLYNNLGSGNSGSENEGNILLLNNNTNLNNNINKNNNININIKLDILNLVEFPILYIKLIENDGNINKLKLLLPIGLYLTLIPLKYNINNFNKLWNSMEMNVNKMTRLYLSKVPLDINNLLNLLWKYFSVYVNNNLLLLSSCGNEILLGSIYIKNKTLIVVQLRSISNNLILSTMNVLKEIFSVLNNKYDCSIYNFKLKNVNVLPLKFQTAMVNTTYPMNNNPALNTNAISDRYY